MIHTAAASSLGKMLVKACIKNNIPLLNIVRREEQAEVLRKLGATDIIVTQGEWEK
jgi:NADPH2:quinone reductase